MAPAMRGVFSAVACFATCAQSAIFDDVLNASKGLYLLQSKAEQTSRMNVLWMVVDDLDGKLGHLGHSEAKTPHLDELARDGVSFPMAYSNHPVCAPSRVSMYYGIYGFNSANPWFEPFWHNPILVHSTSAMEQFKKNGYQVYGKGKLFHGYMGEEMPRDMVDSMWTTEPKEDNIRNHLDYGPFALVNGQMAASPAMPAAYGGNPMDSFGSLRDIAKDKGMTNWVYTNMTEMKYVDDNNRDRLPDEMTVDWTRAKLAELRNQGRGQPWILFIGFMKPHIPLHVPHKYFQRIGYAGPPMLIETDDNASYVPVNYDFEKNFADIVAGYGNRHVAFNKFNVAYLAAKAFLDDMVGQVVNAVKLNGFYQNTILILNSDHGFHIGQHGVLGKNTPYDEATHVPIIIRAPGVTQAGGQPQRPVGLIDIYPTVLDLCGIPHDTVKSEPGRELDGKSLVPLLRNPNGEWDGPDGAISLVVAAFDGIKGRQPVVTLRTKEARYIRSFDGAEELYSHAGDDHSEMNDISKTTGVAQKEQLLNQIIAQSGLPLRSTNPWFAWKTQWQQLMKKYGHLALHGSNISEFDKTPFMPI